MQHEHPHLHPSLTVAELTARLKRIERLYAITLLGGLAGYYGGWVDMIVQRLTEILKSFPHLPLWLALSAALPVTWSPLLVYFGITQTFPGLVAILACRRVRPLAIAAALLAGDALAISLHEAGIPLGGLNPGQIGRAHV